jgi:hypothetical protein
LAWAIVCSSLPSSSGRITRCDAKWAAFEAAECGDEDEQQGKRRADRRSEGSAAKPSAALAPDPTQHGQPPPIRVASVPSALRAAPSAAARRRGRCPSSPATQSSRARREQRSVAKDHASSSACGFVARGKPCFPAGPFLLSPALRAGAFLRGNRRLPRAPSCRRDFVTPAAARARPCARATRRRRRRTS